MKEDPAIISEIFFEMVMFSSPVLGFRCSAFALSVMACRQVSGVPPEANQVSRVGKMVQGVRYKV